MKKFYALAKTFNSLIARTLMVIAFIFGSLSSFSQTVVVDPASPWVVPAGVTSVKVEVWGAGGGGGAAIFGLGGGGGGGAYATATFTVSPGQSYTITRGAGGTSTNDGGFSRFTGAAGTITANGGIGGNTGVFGSGSGGAGATGTFNGGNGISGGAGGSAGGGAGNNGNGSNGSAAGGGAGGAGTPNAYPYQGGAGGESDANGAAPGGGGGGAFIFSAGSTGGNGRVVLTYTSGPVPPTVTAISPNPVCAGSGTLMTITGTNFTAAATITFTGAAPVAATFVNATTIRANLPAAAVTGPVSVTTGAGTGVSAGSLTVTAANVPLVTNGAGTYCGSTSISATGGGGGTIYFQGTNAAGTSTALTSPQTVSTSGTYYFRELNACGWGTAYPVTVTVNPLPADYTVTVAASCSSASLTPPTTAGVTYYFQGTAPGTSTANPGATTVFAPGTYYYKARTAAGCWGADKSVAVAFAVTASITTQPVSTTVCVGQNASFSIAATSGTTLSYQWRKGTTNISGANGTTLSFSPATLANAGTDYNCVITDACGSIISNYVSLTVNPVATVPTTQATAMVFPTTGVTSVVGVFTPSATATNYLVVRSLSATVPAPVNGTNYTVGSTTEFGANTFVEYIGPDNTFASSGLNPGTQYYFHVWAFNVNTCSGGSSPLYKTPQLTGSVTTATSTACASRTTLYWAGTGSAFPQASIFYRDNDFHNKRNWSTSSTSYNYANAFPTRCNDVVISLNGSVNIGLTDADAEFYNLTFAVTGNGVQGALITRGFDLTVYGNVQANLTGGNANTALAIGENSNTAASVIDFKANVNLGSSANLGTCYLYGNQNSKVIVRGDLTLGKTAALFATSENTSVPGTLEFDGTGAQRIYYNNVDNYARFNNVRIGNTNNPIVTVDGTVTPDNILGNLTINGSSTLNLNTRQWNHHTNTGNTFTMNGTSKLQLSGIASVANSGTATLVAGSNYPSGYTSSLAAGSTVEYNALHLLTQTINPVPTYGNITLTRSSGSSATYRTNTSAITHAGTLTINNGVVMTMGAGIVSNGPLNVTSGSTLYTESYFVTGNASGTFNLNSGGTLGIGDAAGITTTGTTGNIRTAGTRNYNTGANYIYNGTAAQTTGNGLPATVNDLTIQNANGVTINGLAGTTQTVSGVYYQTTGTFALNGKTLFINNLTRNAGTITGSPASSITVNGTSVPLFFNTATEATASVKDLVLNNAKTANLGTTLNITAGVALGQSGQLALASGAVLTTNDNLVFKSNQYGTASLATVPTGASLVGKATIERYLPGVKAWRFVAASVKTATSPSISQAWRENGSVVSTGYGTQITGPAGNTGMDAVTASASMKYYNSANNSFITVTNTNNSIANKTGYMIYVRGDRAVGISGAASATNLRIKGEVLTGDQNYAVDAHKIQSIGNPYPAAVSFSAVITGNPNIAKSYIAWDPSLNGSYNSGGYQTLSDLDGYEATASGSTLYPLGSLHPNVQSGQAIYVTNPTNSNLTLTITEAMKATGSTSAVSRTVNTVEDRQILKTKLFTAGGVIADGNMVAFDDELSNDIDGDDALKFNNGGENIAISHLGSRFSVEARGRIAVADTIQYDLGNLQPQVYKLSIVGRNFEGTLLNAFLVDRFTGTRTALNLSDSNFVNVNVTADAASKAADRLYIVFSKVAAPLPVTITSVSASRNNDRSIAVKWKVENELNMQKYEIQRSADGTQFSSIISADPTAVNGGTGSYGRNDLSPLAADNFYRIKAISISGQVQYSAIVKVAPLKLNSEIGVYPNPVQNKNVQVRFTDKTEGRYRLQISNKLGQIVYSGSAQVSGAVFTQAVQLDQNIAAGNYQLQVIDEKGTVTTQQIIIQ